MWSMNWVLGESSDDNCDMMRHMGGRLMYFCGFSGYHRNEGFVGLGGLH